MEAGVFCIKAFYGEDNSVVKEPVVRLTRSTEPKPYVVVDLVQGQAPPANVIDARQPIKHCIRNPFTEEQLKALKVGDQLWLSDADLAYRKG